MDYVKLFKPIRLTREDIDEYSSESLWVDVWHLASFSSEGVFKVSIRQSDKYPKKYWNLIGVKKIGFKDRLSLEEMLALCREINQKLALPIEDFQLHGSTLGNSEWLQEQIKGKEEVKL